MTEKKRELKRDRLLIMNWFRQNDYIVNKVVLGEWLKTDMRYVTYLAHRVTKRKELDLIEAALKREV